MNAHRPLPRVRSLVLPAPARGEVSTAPGFGSSFAWGTTAEADTLIRRIDADLLRQIDGADDHDDDLHDDDLHDDDLHDDDLHDDDLYVDDLHHDRVWRRRIVVRGSERAVPLPAG